MFLACFLAVTDVFPPITTVESSAKYRTPSAESLQGGKNARTKKQRRAYKDSVFVDLFARCPEAKENFLSLYNAMHGTKLTAADTDVEPVMLEQTIYTGRYNDVSMLVDGKVIVLAEQQSTVNENMPLRFLEYVSRLYEKLIPLEKRYEHKAVGLPLPEFYVFYNGTADYPAETELRLSNSFRQADRKDFQLELRTKVYNINRRDEIPFLRSCAPLDGYAVLGLYADEARKAGRENFIDYAVQRCIQEGILTDYFNYAAWRRRQS